MIASAINHRQRIKRRVIKIFNIEKYHKTRRWFIVGSFCDVISITFSFVNFLLIYIIIKKMYYGIYNIQNPLYIFLPFVLIAGEALWIIHEIRFSPFASIIDWTLWRTNVQKKENMVFSKRNLFYRICLSGKYTNARFLSLKYWYRQSRRTKKSGSSFSSRERRRVLGGEIKKGGIWIMVDEKRRISTTWWWKGALSRYFITSLTCWKFVWNTRT